MSILTVRSHVLRLTGNSRTLYLAERHNTRSLYPHSGVVGDIDLSSTHKNLELISLGRVSLTEKVMAILRERGIDPSSPALSRRNRGFAIEFVFSCTSGHKTSFDALYAEALEWLIRALPECPVIHAVIHFDQGSPHMHVIVVPLKDGRLRADEVRGYKQVSKQRNHALYAFLKGDYGLDYPERLRGVRKLIGAELAIHAIHQLSNDEIVARIRLELESAIYSRPEPFLNALGITYQMVQDEIYRLEDLEGMPEPKVQENEWRRASAEGEKRGPFQPSLGPRIRT